MAVLLDPFTYTPSQKLFFRIKEEKHKKRKRQEESRNKENLEHQTEAKQTEGTVKSAMHEKWLQARTRWSLQRVQRGQGKKIVKKKGSVKLNTEKVFPYQETKC